MWQEPRCGACGARSSALPVHLACGVVTGEPPCPAARATRRAFLGGAWRALGRAGCAREYERTGGIGTYEALALLVGGRRGLTRDLALELAANFAATGGAWSAAPKGLLCVFLYVFLCRAISRGRSLLCFVFVFTPWPL